MGQQDRLCRSTGQAVKDRLCGSTGQSVTGGGFGPGQWRRHAVCGLALTVRLTESFWRRRGCNTMQQLAS